MGDIDRKFKKRNKKSIRKIKKHTYLELEIEHSLYLELKDLTIIYEASVSNLIYFSLKLLIKTKNILLYENCEKDETHVNTHIVLLK